MLHPKSNIQDKSISSEYNEQESLDTQTGTIGQRVSDEKQLEQKNPYIEAKRLWMLPCIASILLGAYFNGQFQSFIKEQLMESMHMTSSDYSLFVLIPTLPNIPLPLFIGPLLDSIGARKGILVFTLMLSIGMAMCMISISLDSLLMLIIGKTFLQIAVECQGIAHGCIAGKWFSAKGLASAFTFTSLLCKIASSTSGIIYPQLYNINDSLMTPLALGISICAATLFIAFAIFYLDKNAEKYEPAKQIAEGEEGSQVQKKKFEFSDFKKFDKMFWLYALECPMMFGAFYAFENYLQSVLIHKFMIEKTLAGELVSVPYWIAFSTPIFGLLADKFGLRCIFLGITTFLSFASVFILWILPVGENNAVVYTALIIFGIFLSAMCAYLYPTLPLLSKKELLSTAFAVCYATKNGGTALLNYLGGVLIGGDDLGYQGFLLTYVILFLIAFGISILIYFYDRKHGSIINSVTPQRYVDYVVVKRQSRNSNQITTSLL